MEHDMWMKGSKTFIEELPQVSADYKAPKAFGFVAHAALYRTSSAYAD
jgi:hypothetical protein